MPVAVASWPLHRQHPFDAAQLGHRDLMLIIALRRRLAARSVGDEEQHIVRAGLAAASIDRRVRDWQSVPAGSPSMT